MKATKRTAKKAGKHGGNRARAAKPPRKSSPAAGKDPARSRRKNAKRSAYL